MASQYPISTKQIGSQSELTTFNNDAVSDCGDSKKSQDNPSLNNQDNPNVSNHSSSTDNKAVAEDREKIIIPTTDEERFNEERIYAAQIFNIHVRFFGGKEEYEKNPRDLKWSEVEPILALKHQMFNTLVEQMGGLGRFCRHSYIAISPHPVDKENPNIHFLAFYDTERRGRKSVVKTTFSTIDRDTIQLFAKTYKSIYGQAGYTKNDLRHEGDLLLKAADKLKKPEIFFTAPKEAPEAPPAPMPIPMQRSSTPTQRSSMPTQKPPMPMLNIKGNSNNPDKNTSVPIDTSIPNENLSDDVKMDKPQGGPTLT